ncbi:MAG TPA: penicillin-binding protein 2 [Rhodospirillales bacterium]|nr:penicillin-binding protein 2 [Rhodospirillales bacterium]HIL76999.1 penicillin-binding protein 2 [Rhodospirillales bacterium]
MKAPEKGSSSEFPTHVKFEGIRRQALETGRNRLLVTGVLFTLAFIVVAVRLVELAVVEQVAEEFQAPRLAVVSEIPKVRSDIIDRNGVLLATSLPTASLYANPRQILDSKEATQKLVRVFPNINRKKMAEKLSSSKSFVWLKRNLTPKTQFLVNTLGIPGFDFQPTERRVYPHGRLVAHALGLTNIDGRGLSGIEGYFDKVLRGTEKPLELSIDIRVQSLLREELVKAMLEFRAVGAAGLVLDATNGEVRAMISLPDFNPNKPITASGVAGFNRVTKGVYEMGSTFKLFTVAMALDTGTARLKDHYDATKPIKISRYKISDYHAKNRWLSVPEIIIYSSNIGAAKMALDVGTLGQKKYLKRFGMLTPARIDLPEIGTPLTPAHWRQINTMTISYGHGISVSPIQLVSGIAALVNGGILYRPRMIKVPKGENIAGSRVLSRNTSKKMRGLMRLVVRHGTGRNADVPGYLIGGKTGTSNKTDLRGGYDRSRRMSSFVAAFPMDKPRYVILIMIDEPKGTKRTRGYATGGWVAAPVVANVVKRMAPLLGLKPSQQVEKLPKPGDDLFIAAMAKKN